MRWKTQNEDQMANLLSVAEMARLLGVCECTIRRLIKAGELRSVRISRRILVPSSELERVTEKGARSSSGSGRRGLGCEDSTLTSRMA